MNFINWLKNRLLEPSTHGAAAGLLGVLSAVFPQYAPILQGAAFAFGGLGIALPETGGAGGAIPPPGAGTLTAWIPQVHIASNPYLAEAINVGVQAAITKLLEQPKAK